MKNFNGNLVRFLVNLVDQIGRDKSTNIINRREQKCCRLCSNVNSIFFSRSKWQFCEYLQGKWDLPGDRQDCCKLTSRETSAVPRMCNKSDRCWSLGIPLWDKNPGVKNCYSLQTVPSCHTEQVLSWTRIWWTKRWSQSIPLLSINHFTEACWSGILVDVVCTL